MNVKEHKIRSYQCELKDLGRDLWEGFEIGLSFEEW